VCSLGVEVTHRRCVPTQHPLWFFEILREHLCRLPFRAQTQEIARSIALDIVARAG
jgi:hypothetical protein